MKKKILSCFLVVAFLSVTSPAHAVLRAVGGGGGGTIGGPVTGGTANRVLYVNSSGNLAGSANLTFDGTTLTAAALTVTNANGLTVGSTQLVTAGGFVGIGTATPAYLASIYKTSGLYTAQLAIGNVASTTSGKQILLGYDFTNDYGAIQAVDQGIVAKNFIINASGGNVGIGMAPTRELDVAGTFGATGAATLGGTLSITGATTLTGNLLSASNGTVAIGAGGNGFKQLFVDYTNTATVGNVTISKAAGRVNLAAAGTTLTVTNTLVTAASHCFLNSDGAPGNAVAVQFYAVPAAGSFTVNAVPAVTNQTAIDFFCVNAD